MDLSKLKINDYVLFQDGTIARVTRISLENPVPHLYFDKEVKGQESESNNWFYTQTGIWGHEPGVGNDIIKILESNDESE